MVTPARRLYDVNGRSAATASNAASNADSKADSKANSKANEKSGPPTGAGDVVPGGRVVGRGGRCDEKVVLDRDSLEPEVWWFGHLIDGDLGKRGRLHHDRSTHETTLLTGHDGGVYASAALLVHQACDPLAVEPTYFIYDVATQRLDMRDCECSLTRGPYVRDRT